MKLDAAGVLKAMAQVFEDHPGRWTKGIYARNARQQMVHTDADDAYCFCASGFLKRAAYEGLCDWDTIREADTAFRFSAGVSTVTVNDQLGRESVIATARKAAAALHQYGKFHVEEKR